MRTEGLEGSAAATLSGDIWPWRAGYIVGMTQWDQPCPLKESHAYMPSQRQRGDGQEGKEQWTKWAN